MGVLSSLLIRAAGTPVKPVTYDDCVTYWKNLNCKTVEDYFTALDNFVTVFTMNNGHIEGDILSYLSTRSIMQNEEIYAYSGNVSGIISAKNHVHAFNSFINHVISEVPLSEDLIKYFHKQLVNGCYDGIRLSKGEVPGSYKVGDYCTGVADIGAYPEEVPIVMGELLEEVLEANPVTHEDVLTVAAYLHAVFESVHPFADGNGRVGRFIMNYYLVIHGHPPIVIYQEDKETYYMALEVYNRTEQLNGFVQFLKEQTIKTWKNRVR